MEENPYWIYNKYLIKINKIKNITMQWFTFYTYEVKQISQLFVRKILTFVLTELLTMSGNT